MKIVGIVPSTPSPYLRLGIFRLGLPILATKAKNEGHQATIVDENISKIDLNWLKKEVVEADLIIFSSMTATYNQNLWYLDWIRKDLGLKTPTVIGGIHVTFEPEKALDDGFNFVFRHEGELVFPKFLEAFESGGDFSQVPNLCWERGGQKIYNPLSTVLPDLDQDSPFPDFQDTKLFPQWHKKRMMVMETSRSCLYRCDFCTVHPMFGKFRQRKDLESIVEQIKKIEPDSVFFCDDYFAGYKNTERTKKLMELMLRRLDKIPRWGAQIRSDTARDKEWLRMAKRTNCHFVCIGFESSDPQALEEANKKQTLESIEDDIADFREMGLGHIIHASLMVGFDSDDKHTALKLIKWAKKRIDDTPQIVIITPFPGTEFRRRLEREGRLLPEAYNPQLCDGTHAVYTHPRMTPAELQISVKKAYKKAAPFWKNIHLTLMGILNWGKDYLIDIRNEERLRKNFRKAFLKWRAWNAYRVIRKQTEEYLKYLINRERK
jgi:radical SAM superfamily enzyme YgiQ (UPF0313 family)